MLPSRLQSTSPPSSATSTATATGPGPGPAKTIVSRKRLASLSGSRPSISWGRRHHSGSWLQSVTSLGVMMLCPCLVIFTWVALSSFDGSLWATQSRLRELGPSTFVSRYAPKPDLGVAFCYAGWILFQAALYQFLPSQLGTGQLTPAGHLLKYRTNGFLAWVVSHLVFAASGALGLLDFAVLANHWEGILVAANVFGFFLSAFAYVKAHVSPSHEGDRKFSGSILYDMYMGVELNPRFGRYFDFKLFTNGRPGIIAWTMIDFSFIAYQYQLHGFITKSILIATALHTIYVVDFFINEDWYLRTIDICHDHFGFYLAWGSIVWLPSMYTLQTQYLARNPVMLSNFAAISLLLTGVGGYALFRSVNHQKDYVRRTKGKCNVWGAPAKTVRVRYQTCDGLEHESLLLCSGWWGIARHVNYFGDLVLSYSMCAVCGFQNLLPWSYAIFMTILLLHRCRRDEARCLRKYGKGWEDYCKIVKWAIIPGVY